MIMTKPKNYRYPTNTEIKTRLKKSIINKKCIAYDIEQTVDRVFTVRTMTRKILGNRNVNERVMINNTIIACNIFGIETSYTIFNQICSESELQYVNTIYLFLQYKNFENNLVCDYFLQLLHANCNIYLKLKTS